ncbi:MAG: hypothetical protein KBE65_11665 [Phycisphaerae bacterium]|nr:hypothetical protein [Phycisphaerae bacterium]
MAVCIGPEHGTVGPELVKEAACVRGMDSCPRSEPVLDLIGAGMVGWLRRRGTL